MRGQWDINYCSVLDLAQRPGEGQDARWRQRLYSLDSPMRWGGRMGSTGQVVTATDLTQLIPSLGGIMVVLGDV